ncbi:uncharacterized protein LOC132196883 [Neocloeon triangulifer]|uniref:uncharacterized protein LOC132196883 n=1 Tax=Neocloeon triangulifer TaxID=2078957 RepID=UPI00286F0D96|nr:uncharacterized protein LOC132196883 [Neocloeon triangulifer]XP_059475801.1 uncharacterized protein LOC132196883 [Neocloeon triangulifer]
MNKAGKMAKMTNLAEEWFDAVERLTLADGNVDDDSSPPKKKARLSQEPSSSSERSALKEQIFAVLKDEINQFYEIFCANVLKTEEERCLILETSQTLVQKLERDRREARQQYLTQMQSLIKQVNFVAEVEKQFSTIDSSLAEAQIQDQFQVFLKGLSNAIEACRRCKKEKTDYIQTMTEKIKFLEKIIEEEETEQDIISKS